MKRMQVLLDDTEYRRIQKVARRQGLTLAAWVRRALRSAYREEPLTGKDKKLAAVRAAMRHQFPTADIDEMLEEIALGYKVAEP